MINLFKVIQENKDYQRDILELEDELLKSNAIVEELRLIVAKQNDTIIDLSASNSSVELMGSVLESRDFEVTKWQNKYVDLVNRNLDKIATNNIPDDRIEADGDGPDKEQLNKTTPWHVRRRQLEREDRMKAGQLRQEATSALSNRSFTVEGLTTAAKELEEDFNRVEEKLS